MKEIIDLKKYFPKIIVPKIGVDRELMRIENNDNYILSCTFAKKKITIPKRIILNANDFIAIGLYLAEGYTKINRKKKYYHDGSVTFVGSYKEMINPICDLLEKLNISKEKLKWKIGINVNIKRKFTEIIKYWVKNTNLRDENLRAKSVYYTGTLGKPTIRSGINGCVHIFFPSVVFRSFFLNFINLIFQNSLNNKNIKELSLILKGFFAGDGSVNYCKKYNRRLIDFASNNPELIGKLKEALSIIGISSIKETYPELGKSNNKSLRIYNKKDFLILQKNEIPNLLSYKKKIFDELMNSY
ncbi:hypothetical protein HOD05_04510 [Candidatus Woesearchaeota archaeon]|jgi:hypothetical protein|nr:hypothetical protein [Candidatus Woesearchaeota archaeon]MBT4150419.1 hypothetical protein [Candidatus Woesearchaeota archaeon]MBT4247506.1 hypothetical protein [Candidatus Woesearchaeota archaeon]MBT4434455.1 hypothetical protein [Candidatus Woesearchaeota archaeon]MBT7331691.1 hypothetical protein [Candidatus Woesearchaeota archaeon]